MLARASAQPDGCVEGTVTASEALDDSSNRRGVLVVLAGRPGTGKTTIGRLLARRLQAAYLRTDVIAGSMLLGGLTSDSSAAGRSAYEIARDVARENLTLHVPVVVDGVNATLERRALWREVSEAASAPLVQIEMTLSDVVEHRRRVERREIAGYVGPTWRQIQGMQYDSWTEAIDGPRLLVDTSDTDVALSACLAYVAGGNLA